ncbi:Unknown protein, partial [Striga hermonthica]
QLSSSQKLVYVYVCSQQAESNKCAQNTQSTECATHGTLQGAAIPPEDENLNDVEQCSNDDDYVPSNDESDDYSSEDGLSDDNLGTDDEEYLAARRDRVMSKKSKNAEVIKESSVVRDLESDYENSDGSVNTDSPISEHGQVEDDSAGVSSSKKKLVVYDPKCDHSTLQFVLGMRFDSVMQLKSAIQKSAIHNGCNIQFMRTSQKQVEARCIDSCPWRLYGSLVQSEGRVAIKRLVSEHQCFRDIRTIQATSQWVANEYLEKFRKQPSIKASDMQDLIMDKFGVQPSKWKLYREKYKALEILRGYESEHYGCLRNYIAELQRVDRNGRFEMLLEEGHVFKAFFVGFSALREGFLQGSRPIIGFDGCFLKTFLGGVLLCAIGKDGNNQIYPLAWAIADSENENNWRWFLTILFQELRIEDGLGWTFISDQQK